MIRKPKRKFTTSRFKVHNDKPLGLLKIFIIEYQGVTGFLNELRMIKQLIKSLPFLITIVSRMRFMIFLNIKTTSGFDFPIINPLLHS